MVVGSRGWLTGPMLRNAWRVSVTWMVLFAAVHVYWGFGGTGLLPEGVSVLESSSLFVVDLIAIPLCLAGAATAWLLRPGQRHGKLASRAWLLWPATVATAVLLGHVASGLLLAVPVAASIGVIVRFGIERYLESKLYRGNGPLLIGESRNSTLPARD